MSPFQQNIEIRRAVLDVMKQGGFYDNIMQAGPQLDRVKIFLQRMEQSRHQDAKTLQHPTVLPLFPGLDNRPMRDPDGLPGAEYLKAHAEEIKAIAEGLSKRSLSYDGVAVSEGLWKIYPLWYMGLSLPFMTMHCPRLKAIAEGLPGCGKLHPFSEALLSWQDPNTHIDPHCSVDNLRLRYSLGVVVNGPCTLRAGNETRSWQEGEVIVFEDCFEHEAINGDKERLVFIIDAWHPGLTAIEIEALSAAFRKHEVRKILYEFRISEPLRPFLDQQFIVEDAQPLLKRYWDFGKTIEIPTVTDWGVWDTVPVFED